MAAVIDVHTHMLTEQYLALLEQHAGPKITLKTVVGGLRAIHLDDAPFMTPVPQMFDYPARIKMMDTVGIDVSVISLTCPNVYWGGDNVPLMQWGNLLTYQNLKDLRAGEGFEKDGVMLDPQFADWKNLDLRVAADSPLLKMGCYPKGEVPRVKLGVIGK